MLDMKWRYVLLIFTLSFFLSWLGFAGIWWDSYLYTCNLGAADIVHFSSKQLNDLYQRGILSFSLSIYRCIVIKQTLYPSMYLPVSLFQAWTTRPISTKFCQTSTPTQGRFQTQVWSRQTDPLTWGTPSSKTSTDYWRKTLLYKKFPDGGLNLIKFFPGGARPRLACKCIN